MTQPHYVHETQLLKRVASNPECRIRFTAHALERMAERGILAADICAALTNGQVVLSEVKRDNVWRVMGKDTDGNKLQVEAVVYEDVIKIKVVTAF